MGIAERKQREKNQRHELILVETRRLILEKGAWAVSMQDVADAVEISKAALYLHFDSKEAIFLEIIADAVGKFHDFVIRKLEGRTNGLDRLLAVGEAFMAFYRGEEELFIFAGLQEYFLPGYPLINDEFSADPAAGLKQKLESMILDTVETGFRDGSFDPALNPEETFRTVLFVAISLIHKIAKLPNEKRDMNRLLSEMKAAFELLLRGLVHPSIDKNRLFIHRPSDKTPGPEKS